MQSLTFYEHSQKKNRGFIEEHVPAIDFLSYNVLRT